MAKSEKLAEPEGAFYFCPDIILSLIVLLHITIIGG